MLNHIDRIHPHLTFDEANIVQMNIIPERGANTISLAVFQYRLENLLRHTPDSCLAGSIRTLQKKVRYLSQAEFEQLCRDSAAGKVISTENYQLPSM